MGELAIWRWRAGLEHAPSPRYAEPYTLSLAGDAEAAAHAWERIGAPHEQALALCDGKDPQLPDLIARLRAAEAPWIADLGCGQGFSTVALADAFPNAHVDGVDADAASIAEARANALAAGSTAACGSPRPTHPS